MSEIYESLLDDIKVLWKSIFFLYIFSLHISHLKESDDQTNFYIKQIKQHD